MKLQQFTLTHVGLTRQENQDSVFAMPEHGVYLVADGMGGEKAGAEASAQVVATVKRRLTEFFENQSRIDAHEVGAAAIEALQLANKEVYEISVREPDKAGLGSTGSLLLVLKGLYFVSQVGDSRVYLVRGGKVQMLTRDHSIVWELYENGIINRDQMETHPERHLLTQCIGGNKPVHVDLFSGRCEPGDLFLICSDGLTSYAGEAEVLRILIDPVYSLEERAYRLLKAAMEGGGGDNVSVVLVAVDEVGPTDDWQPIAPPSPQPRSRREGTTTTIRVVRSADRGGGGGSRVAAPPPARGKSSLLLGGGMIALGAAALLLVLALKHLNGAGPAVEFLLPPGNDPAQCAVVLLDLQGQPVAEDEFAVENLETGAVRVVFPKKDVYKVAMRCPFAVVDPVEVDLNEQRDAPVELAARPAGAIVLKPADPARVRRVKILNLSKGEDAVLEEFGEGEPRPSEFRYELPAGPYRVEVFDAQDALVLDEGRVQVEERRLHEVRP